MIAEAQQQRDQILSDAEIAAQKCLDAVQEEVNDKLAEGKRKYIAVQEEMNEIVELINQAQRRFMASYKEVHRIISTMPETLRELEDEEGTGDSDAAAAAPCPENTQPEDDSFDEEDEDLSEAEMKKIFGHREMDED